MRPRGFTLLELLIAISLGTMVVIVGYAAVRVSTTSIAAGSRLMNENALLRQAMLTGIEQLDFGAPGELGIAGQDSDAGLGYRTPSARAAVSIYDAGGAVKPEWRHLTRAALRNRPCEDWWAWRANLDGNGWSYATAAASEGADYEYDPTVPAGAGIARIRPQYQRDLLVPGDGLALRGMKDDAYQAMVGWAKTVQMDLYAVLGYQAMLEYLPPNTPFYCGPLTKGRILASYPSGNVNYTGNAPKYTGASNSRLSAGSPFELSSRLQKRGAGNDIADGGAAQWISDDSDLPWGTLIDAKGAGRAGWDGNWIAARQRGLPEDWPRCGVIVQRAWTDAIRLNRVEVKLRSVITGQDLSIAFNLVGADLPGLRKSHGLHD
jgi:prepilin-type N-terminal cleavage/methylation domain-containing protein